MENKSSDKIVSIAFKIMGWMIGVVVAMLLLVGIIIYNKVVVIDEEAYDNKIETVLAVFNYGIDTYYGDIEEMTNILAQDDDVINACDDPSEYEDSVINLFESYKKKKLDLESIVLVLNDGTTFAYPEDVAPEDPQNSSWYAGALDKKGRVFFTDVYLDQDESKVVTSSVTVKDDNDNEIGVLSLTVNYTEVEELLACTVEAKEDDEYYMLLAEDGTMVINQIDSVSEFTKFQELDVEGVADFNHGDDEWYEVDMYGNQYEFWTWPVDSKYFEGDYVAIIPIFAVYQADHAVRNTVIIITIIAFIIAAIVSFIMGYNIVTPLRKTVNLLKNISEGDGDLTQRLPVEKNNELTLLAKYFNKTMDKVQGTVKTVIKESSVMSDGSQELSQNMAETTSALNQITSNISSIKNEIINQSAGVEETSATIKQISDNISRLTGNIDTQANSVNQSSAAVEEMVANIRSVSEILDKNSVAVHELENSAEKGRIVVQKTVELTSKIESDSEGLLEASSVIQNIASQTNLLAMNAAIEAAHAGEVGQGFSVVADEIRKLAEDSSTQGKRISEALKELKDTIGHVTGASKDIQAQFNVIFENTQRVSQQESVIKAAMDEQNAGSQQILNAMQDINDITGEVKSGAQLMEQGGKEIAVEMEKLANVTVEISSSMNEMNSGVSEINNAMAIVNTKTIENDEAIKRVSEEINRFKVE